VKVLLTNKGQPTIVVERTNKGDIKVVHLATGIHATYHQNGHNHFFDPKSTKSWRKEIEELGGHDGELINCTTSRPFSEIFDPEFFIAIGSQSREWKEKYKKLNRLEINTELLVSIYLSSKESTTHVTVLNDAHPYVLVGIV
jgi:hypothetical protein